MIDKTDVKQQIHANGYADIRIKNGSFTIEARPHYCDRGNYIVKIFVDEGQTDLFIDGQDMFPRYYFDFDGMIKEIAMWTDKNNQILETHDNKASKPS